MAMLASKHGRARNVNINLNTAGGNKKQGLPPSSVEHTRLVKTRAGGENRNVVFCMNQLGGVGRGKSQFKVNGSNHPDGSRGCVTGQFPIGGSPFFTAVTQQRLGYLLNQMVPAPNGQIYAAMPMGTESFQFWWQEWQNTSQMVNAQGSQLVSEINNIIGNPNFWINRVYNGKGMQKLGIHSLVTINVEDALKMIKAGYGVALVKYDTPWGKVNFFAFATWCPSNVFYPCK